MYTRDCIELNNQTLDQAAGHYCLKAWVVPQNFHQVCFPTYRAGLVVMMTKMMLTKMICIHVLVVVVDTMCSLPFSLKAFCQPWPSP